VRIKLDENLGRPHVALLRRYQYEADRLFDEGLSGIDDAEVWRHVRQEKRFLITLDLGFADVRRYLPGTYPGILLLRPRSKGRGSMEQVHIFFPMIALVGLTFVVLLLIPYVRFKAGFQGRLGRDDFKFGESPNVPSDVSLPNRNLMNLLEMPVLFYVACITLYVTQNVDGIALFLAWLYFGLRLCHSVVHITYNKIFHRFLVFAASNVVLAVIWARLFRDLFK